MKPRDDLAGAVADDVSSGGSSTKTPATALKPSLSDMIQPPITAYRFVQVVDDTS